jgi:hypothetical protein
LDVRITWKLGKLLKKYSAAHAAEWVQAGMRISKNSDASMIGAALEFYKQLCNRRKI